MPYEFVESDTGSKLVVPCKDNESGAVINLTGATVTLRYKYAGDAAVTERGMTIQTPATNGIAEYLFGTGELKTGRFSYEVKIVDGAGKVITQLDLGYIDVRARLAA